MCEMFSSVEESEAGTCFDEIYSLLIPIETLAQGKYTFCILENMRNGDNVVQKLPLK